MNILSLNKLDKKIIEQILLFLSFFSFLFLWDIKFDGSSLNLRALIFLMFPYLLKDFLKINIPIKIIISFFFIHLFFVSFFFDITLKLKTFIQLGFTYYVFILAFKYYKEFFSILLMLSKAFITLFFLLSLVNIFNLSFHDISSIDSDGGSCAFFLDTSLTFNLKVFTENSHFGMIASGVFVYFILNVNLREKILINIFFIFTILLLSTIFTSTTLVFSFIISSLVIILFCFDKKKLPNFYLLILFLILNLAIFFGKKECYTRISRTDPLILYKISKLEKIKKNLSKDIEFKDKLIEDKLSEDKLSEDKLRKNKLGKESPPEILELELNKLVNEIKEREAKYKSTNLTAEVYQNSLLVTLKTLANEKIGSGFDNYSYAFDKYTKENMKINNFNYLNSEKILPKVFSDEIVGLNRTDARANFFKITTEFGIFSVIIYLYLIFFTLSRKVKNEYKTFLVPMILTSMISAAGYFNAGFILCIGLTIPLLFRNEKIK